MNFNGGRRANHEGGGGRRANHEGGWGGGGGVGGLITRADRGIVFTFIAKGI